MAITINGGGTITGLTSGAGSAAAALSGQVPDANAPSGSVIQVINATTLGSTSTSGSTFIATTLTATITPFSASSKILIFGQAFAVASLSQSQPQITLYRGGNDVIGTNYGFGNLYSNGGGYNEGVLAFSFLDSPSSTSATTYTIYMRNNGVGTGTIGTGDRLSVITLMEIAA
jgi:hypothetical protein